MVLCIFLYRCWIVGGVFLFFSYTVFLYRSVLKLLKCLTVGIPTFVHNLNAPLAVAHKHVTVSSVPSAPMPG